MDREFVMKKKLKMAIWALGRIKDHTQSDDKIWDRLVSIHIEADQALRQIERIGTILQKGALDGYPPEDQL